MEIKVWVVFVLNIFLPACGSVPTGEDIQIKCDWGVQGRNILDTKAGTFQHDMVSEPPITIPFVLTGEEKNRILDTARAMGFFSFMHQVQTAPWMSSNAPYHYLRIETPESSNWIDWFGAIDSQSEKARNAWILLNMVIEIVESKPEFKSLPRPKGFYI